MSEEGKNLFVTGFIDVDLWNKAQWRAVFFGAIEGGPPILGLAFKNKGAAIRIFKGWRERFGQIDEHEELRISIVEGSLPGEKEFSYAVHIGADIENNVAQIEKDGYKADLITNITRIHRMYPAPDSNNLENFKKMYQQTQGYILIPGYIDSNNKVEMLSEYRLVKRKIHLRDIKDIKDNQDPDYVTTQTPSE